MCGQLADQASAQAPEGMGIVLFNGKLSRELSFHRFNELSNGVVKMSVFFRNRDFLIVAWQGTQTYPVLCPKFSNLWRTDISFIAEHFQVSMLPESLKTGFKATSIRR